MPDNKYIVKSLAPWMIDELLVFSTLTKFDLILLREQDEFYSQSLKQLENNGVTIYIKPFKYNSITSKLSIIFSFLMQNMKNFRLNYNSVIGLKSIVWFLKFDIKLFSSKSKIHAQFATQAALISVLLKMYYKNKPQVSITFHAYDIYNNNTWFKYLVEHCQWAYSISNFNIKYVSDNYIKSNKIILSRLGVFRKENHVQKTNKIFTLGLLSWFVEKKGIIYLLSAIKLLKENGYSDIKLILAGDGPLKVDYLKYIEENNLEKYITYIGVIQGNDKRNFYESLDVFVLPSIKLKNDQDGIPVVLMEAIAYSLPIISTNISGIPEICVDNYNGALIKERDVNAIYHAILQLYNDKKNRTTFAKNI